MTLTGRIVLAAWCALASLESKAEARNPGALPPNMLMIISDDHGWRDHGFMGHPHVRTPHLDELASQSRVFTRGYVPTSLCSPSLASLVTGLYPHQHLITSNDPPAPPGGKRGNWRLHPQYIAAWEEMRRLIKRSPMLPQLLRQKRYLSLQTGKWWLGSYRDGGFTDGMTHGDRRRGGRHGDAGLKIGRTTMQPIYDFIDRAQEQKQPFLVWYAAMLPHSPHDAPQHLIDAYAAKAPDAETARYWASIERYDETVGALLDHLDRKGLTEETIVVYLTDNGWAQGPHADTHHVRSKRSPYDAGIRTPIVIRWPGRVKPGRSTRLASSLDLMPTLLATGGIAPPAGLPGVDLLDDEAVAARSALYGAVFTHDAVDIHDPSANLVTRWIIDGEWKLMVPVAERITREQSRQIELYHITADPEEKLDLAAHEPERVEALKQRLDAWWTPVLR